MKKILLATTGAAALMLLSAPASAQITVTLGGYVNFEAGFWDVDGIDSTDRDFRNDTEVHVRADGKADNGLLYGVHVEMDSSGADVFFDENNLYVAGDWGRIELGDQDGAAEVLSVYAPVVGIGQVDGDYGDFVGALGDVALNAPDSSDSTKATYITPSIAGFQAGISYAPEENSGDSVVTTEPTTGFSDYIETGVNYAGEFSGLAVTASATYTQADANAAGADDPSAVQFGTQIGYGGFTVGGSYVELDEDIRDTAWNVGVTYATGPFGVGVSYYSHDGEAGTDDLDFLALGGTYTVAPGLTVGADYHHFEFSGVGDDTEGDLVIVSTRVTF